MKKAPTALALLGVLSLVPTWSAGASAAPAPSLTSLSAGQIANLSLASAHAQGTCTSVAQIRAAGLNYTTSTNSGVTVAQQVVSVNHNTETAVLVGSVVYAKWSAGLIQLQFGTSLPQYANRWIAIASSDKHFASIATGMLFSSMIAQVRPAGVLKKAGVTTVRGIKSIAITGAANSRLGLTGGTETLFVQDAAPYLPVELLAAGRSQGAPTTLVVTFSHWGQHFSYRAPGAALPISSTTLP
jgi:hypothetical protein